MTVGELIRILNKVPKDYNIGMVINSQDTSVYKISELFAVINKNTIAIVKDDLSHCQSIHKKSLN